MSLPLLDYHSLEDGELNRLWYEENDPRARDAFRLRWWLGGDTVAGRDLLAEYHTDFMHRCFGRGVQCEEDQLETFRIAVKHLVADFPADPIPKFEEFLLPMVDRGIDATLKSLTVAEETSAAEDRTAIDAALSELGDDGARLRKWCEGTAPELDPQGWEALLVAARALITKLDGAEAAMAHPLVRIEEPPPSKLDESVAVPHYGAEPLFRYAIGGGKLGKREDAHNEWCQPCRQRCVGALLLMNRMRRALGGTIATLPDVSPEFDSILQKDDPGVPVIDPSKRTQKVEGSGSKTGLFVTVAIIAVIVVAAILIKLKS